MRRRRREETEQMSEEESGGRRRDAEGRSSGSVAPAQSTARRPSSRIRWGLLSWSTRTLLMGVLLMMMMGGGGVEALRCQCSRSTEAAHCSQQLCDIKERNGKVPACVFVRDGPLQHYACIRVEEEREMGCRVMRGRDGGHKVACMCRDADMCNVDLADRVDDGGGERRLIKVPAELIGEPSVVRVRAEERREGGRGGHDVLLEPDRDDTLGVAPSVVDLFDEEDGVGRGGGGGLIQRERESWSDEDEKRNPSSYRFVQGVDNRQLVPLSVKRFGEEKGRSKLDENVIDLMDPHYRRPVPPSPAATHRPHPLHPDATRSHYTDAPRRPDWRQPGAQPVPRGPYEARREEEERRRVEEERRRGEGAVHRVEWTTRTTTMRSRPPPPPTTTTTRSPPPASPPVDARQPTPFTIGRINTFVERPSPDPVPYPRRWDDRVYPPAPAPVTTSIPTTTTTAVPPTTTTSIPRRYSWSVSKYVSTTTTTTVPSTVPTTTTTTEQPTTVTTVPETTTTTTTLPPTTTTKTTTTSTTTKAPTTTTLRSTVAPSTTATVDYDDMDGGEEEEYDEVALASGTKTNSVPRVAEKEPDSGTINTIWTTVVVTAVLIGTLW